MSDSPVNFSTGLPETVLEPLPDDFMTQIESALALPIEQQRKLLSDLAMQDPQSSEVWSRLSEASGDVIEAYAYARVGYHRGLDALRKAGWRGSGYVKWQEPSNRGFLRSLENLRRRAQEIGETDEAERCAIFLKQLDPAWNGLPDS